MADQNPAGPEYPSSAPLPSAAEQAPYEMGYPLPLPDKADILPPGQGHLAFPHFLSFASVVNLATRTYRYTYDEAIKDSFTNSLAIRRDPIVYEAMRSRQVPVAQLPWHLEASNDQDPRQAEAVQVLSDIVDRIPRFQQLTMQLLEAVYYGRYGSQLVYGWDFSTGRKLLVVRDHKPINGDKLVFRYSGQAGVLVHSTFAGPWEVSDRGRVHFFTASERETIILHRHEPEDADFFEGELAGGIQGVGLRSRIYYLWKLKNQVLAIMMDYLERVGAGGFTVYYYDAGNPKSLAEVTAAAQQQFRNNTILFPRYRNSRGVTGGPGVERVEAGVAGAELLRHLVMDYFDETIRRTIGGSRLTREGSRSLIGSADLANLDAETEANYVKYDAVNLQETFTAELVSVLQRYNFPMLPAGAIRFKYDVDKPNTAEVLEAAERFFNMGGTLDEDDTRTVLGLPAPEPGHTVLSKMGNMQAEMAAQAMMSPPGAGAKPPSEPPPSDGSPPVQFKRDKKGRIKYAVRPPRIRTADPQLLAIANNYSRSVGLPGNHPAQVEERPIDLAASTLAGNTYDAIEHNPNDPEVRAAYDAFNRETAEQYKHLVRNGYKFILHGPESTDETIPYVQGLPAGDPNRVFEDRMIDDIRGKKQLHIIQAGDIPGDHPLLDDSGVTVADAETGKQVPVNFNMLFRGVHDVFGHALYGHKFNARGEEAAYQAHSRMYSPLARKALATETRGQNSWLNFGPHMQNPATGKVRGREEPGAILKADKPFAPEKAAILPNKVMTGHFPPDHPAVSGAAGPAVTGPEQPQQGEKKTGPVVQFARHGEYARLRAAQETLWVENEYLDRKANQSPEQADRWLNGYMGSRIQLATDLQPGPVRMSKRDLESYALLQFARKNPTYREGTPEYDEGEAAKAAFSNGQLGVREYIAAQPPGHMETIDGNTYLSSIDGPQVRRMIPTATVTMRPQSYRNPDIIKAIRKQLRDVKAGGNVDTSTGDPIEPISVVPNPKAAGQWRVFDGHHRLDAYEAENEQEIPAWTPV